MATKTSYRCSRCATPVQVGVHFCPTCGADLSVINPVQVHETGGRPSWLLPALTAVLVVAVVAAALLFVRHSQQTPTVAVGANRTSSAPVSPVSETPGTRAVTPTTAPPSTTQTPTATVGARSFADVYSDVERGVVRINSVTCDGGGVGTGFFVDPTHVVTAAHVVEGAAALQLEVGEDASVGTTSGTVVGIDHDVDIALITIAAPIKGARILTMASTDPRVGTAVAVIGFPKGEQMSQSLGAVSGLNRTIPIDGTDRSGLIQTDASINFGNSGGPMLTLDGSVVGVVDAKNTEAEGIAYAVAATTTLARIATWKGLTASVVTAGCAAPLAPPDERAVVPKAPGGGSGAVGFFFQTYFSAINDGNYQQVWAMLVPNLAGANADHLATSLSTTYDTDVVVHAVTAKPGGAVLAHVSFTSFQAPDKGPHGDTCDRWDLDYLLKPAGSSWQISAVSGYNNGATHVAC